MKKKNIDPKQQLILVSIIVFIIGGAFGFIYAKKMYFPKNCSDLAVTFLEMGKKYYDLNPSEVSWNKAVETETKIMNTCLEQFPKQYHWNK